MSRRESHDASAFYERFAPPPVVLDEEVVVSPVRNQLVCGDARHMARLPDKSVALVVTSPPYFAAKDYELGLGSYAEFMELLHDVFAECARVLEPGGRMAVNVANLGRRPYRSLAGDVARLLQDDLGLLLRGEVVWVKGDGANGNCAWGSFGSSANPVLRDTSERIIVASKGRFDRALSRAARKRQGLPHESTITREEFMALTLDVWRFPPASARRIGHPAPFPLELPRRLIELYSYRGDLVLDPFMGSGQVAIAARDAGRDYVGYELDPAYVALAEERLASSASKD